MVRFTEAEVVEVCGRGVRLGRGTGRLVVVWVGLRVRSEAFVESSGGVRPAIRKRPAHHLSLIEREEISRGLATGESMRCIAARLGRVPSTVSREVAAGGGRDQYRATVAHRASRHRAQRPKPAKLATNFRLRKVVETKLEAWWSPVQISDWLVDTYPDDEEMRVSHETIYQSLFIQGKGALRKELWRCLRTGQATRRPQGRPASTKGKIRDMVMISERPAEVEDRAVPGHWEGDLLKTGAHSAAKKLERATHLSSMATNCKLPFSSR